MKLIELGGKYGKNKFALVDDEWFGELSKHKWHSSKKGYAERKTSAVGKQHHIFMHRVVNNTPPDKITDHINQNRLDNRAENLRDADCSINGANKPKPFGKGKYLGVTKDRGYYRAQIWKDQKCYKIGSFAKARWAAMARDLASLTIYGEHTQFNFPTAIMG